MAARCSLSAGGEASDCPSDWEEGSPNVSAAMAAYQIYPSLLLRAVRSVISTLSATIGNGHI